MTPDLEKAHVVAQLCAALDAEIAALRAITDAARDEATHAESRPENQYDTRALEASYLAAGQGERLTALERLRAWLAQVEGSSPVDIAGEGALVRARVGGKAQWFLLGPTGGLATRVANEPVQLVSTRSPLGAALVGLAEGDAAALETPRGPSEVEVERVR